jgi:hypothetical protein
LLALPEPLELEYHYEIEQIEEEKHMTYITTAERIGIRKGLLKGRTEGRTEVGAEVLLRLLQRKFKFLPATYHKRIQQADAETLLNWAEHLLDAKTLDDVFVEA